MISKDHLRQLHQATTKLQVAQRRLEGGVGSMPGAAQIMIVTTPIHRYWEMTLLIST